jgi:predicted nucleic acid-binding protein
MRAETLTQEHVRKAGCLVLPSGGTGTGGPIRPPGASGRVDYGQAITRFVIDPLTLVHLADGRFTVNPAHQLVAPTSIRSQALDVLLQRVRSGKLSEQEAMQLHERMTELKMRLLGDRVSRRTAWQMALEHGWDTIQEAEYLAVARLQADALVTLSPSLAAKAAGVVPLGELTDVIAC